MKRIGAQEKVVWKYPVPDREPREVALPAGAVVLHAGFDPDEVLCLWAEVDPAGDTPRKRRVHVRDTGETFYMNSDDVGGEYVGTFLSRSGMFVWHVYVERERP